MKFAIAALIGATSALRTQGMPSGMSASGTANDGPQTGRGNSEPPAALSRGSGPPAALAPGSVGTLCTTAPTGSPTVTCTSTQQLYWMTVAKDKCDWVCGKSYGPVNTPPTKSEEIKDFVSGFFRQCDKNANQQITMPELKQCLTTIMARTRKAYANGGGPDGPSPAQIKHMIDQMGQNYEQMGTLVYKNASYTSMSTESVTTYLSNGGWEKVQAIMNQGMEEPPAKKEEPPAPVAPAPPKSICGGIFASMDVIPGWQTTRPQSHTAEQCLDRCATKKECIVVLFKGNGECWACTQYHGKCYENNHGDQVYLARKPAALPTPVAPKSICNGGYGSMTGVGNWNTQSPHSADANACLERCAGRSGCKYVRFNYTNNNCYAYKAFSGKCYANDHDHIYSVDGQQQ